jgi:hypothetical protein
LPAERVGVLGRLGKRGKNGTWGEIQIVWTAENLVLDVQARNYDTAGYLPRGHAGVNKYVQTAVRLHQLFGEAIEASLNVPTSRSQPGLWSDATMAVIATRWGRRAAG